jgi:hypothetical protein
MAPCSIARQEHLQRLEYARQVQAPVYSGRHQGQRPPRAKSAKYLLDREWSANRRRGGSAREDERGIEREWRVDRECGG